MQKSQNKSKRAKTGNNYFRDGATPRFSLVSSVHSQPTCGSEPHLPIVTLAGGVCSGISLATSSIVSIVFTQPSLNFVSSSGVQSFTQLPPSFAERNISSAFFQKRSRLCSSKVFPVDSANAFRCSSDKGA